MKEFKVISRREQKADFSGLCVKKNWGYVNSNGSSFGYATKRQAKVAAEDAQKYIK